MAVYFTSDTHLGHANFIKGTSKWTDTSLCRPFDTVEEHDNTLIDAINTTVTNRDVLYHLGDFCFPGNGTRAQKRKIIAEYRERIHPTYMYLLLGNHDKSNLYTELDPYYTRIFSPPYLELKATDQHPDITLCHYAMRTWNKSHFGTWHLFGHTHAQLAIPDDSLSMDVGVDCHLEWKPFSLDEIAAHMAKKAFIPINKR